MSIVKHLPELPKEGTVVYADNPPYSSDRAIFEGGRFIGGGEFPVKSYEMAHVTKWFDFHLYIEKMKEATGERAFSVCFDLADKLTD